MNHTMTTTTTTMMTTMTPHDMIQQLESYDINHNMKHHPSNDDDTTTTISMNEYRMIRDTYLHRKCINTVVEHITTSYDDKSKTFHPYTTTTIINPTTNNNNENDHDNHSPNGSSSSNSHGSTKQQQQQQQLLLIEQHQQRVLQHITNQTQLLQQKQLELYHKYNYFQNVRRQEYIQSLQDVVDEECDDDNDTTTTNNIDSTIEYDQDMIQYDMLIKQLHEQKAYQSIQLRTVQQQYHTYEQQIATCKQMIFNTSNNSNDDGDNKTKKKNDHNDIVQQKITDILQQHKKDSINTNFNIDTTMTTTTNMDVVNDMEHIDTATTTKVLLDTIQTENELLNQQLDEIHNVQQFYQSFATLLQDVYGIRFVSYKTTQSDTNITASDNGMTMTDSSSNTTNLNTTISNNNNNNNMIIVTVQLLKQYDVEIMIQDIVLLGYGNKKSSSCTIQSATIISNNGVVSSSSLCKNDSTNHDDNENHTTNNTNKKHIQIRIPDFHDIVQYVNYTYSSSSSSSSSSTTSKTTTTGEMLRTLFREMIGRITMIQERVKELYILQQQDGIVLSIGPICTSSNNNNNIGPTTNDIMIHDQEVICSMNDPPLTIVLRLTMNCPIYENSIYVDEIIGIGGWNPIIIQQLMNNITTTPTTSTTTNPNNTNNGNLTKTTKGYRTPIQIIHTIRMEIQQMMKMQQQPSSNMNINDTNVGVQLPSSIIPITPRIPTIVVPTSQQQQKQYHF